MVVTSASVAVVLVAVAAAAAAAAAAVVCCWSPGDRLGSSRGAAERTTYRNGTNDGGAGAKTPLAVATGDSYEDKYAGIGVGVLCNIWLAESGRYFGKYVRVQRSFLNTGFNENKGSFLSFVEWNGTTTTLIKFIISQHIQRPVSTKYIGYASLGEQENSEKLL